MKRTETYPARPFVKWAGGKSKLLDDIRHTLPPDLSQREGLTYIEPFVGGGAVLFWILQAYPNITRAVINDVNAALVCTYRVVKSEVEPLIAELARLQSEYLPLDTEARKAYFYARRDSYNQGGHSDVMTAALFIFLNRTCFNGLYRVNARGRFNVPHGRYARPLICDADTLRADSAVLQRVEILCGDFSQTGAYARPGVLYYLDPPYRPLTATAAFTAYAEGGFDDAEQVRLRDFCSRIAAAHAWFVASNSDPHNVNAHDDFFDSLYRMFRIRRVSAARMISAQGTGRAPVSELMISNVSNAY